MRAPTVFLSKHANKFFGGQRVLLLVCMQCSCTDAVEDMGYPPTPCPLEISYEKTVGL